MENLMLKSYSSYDVVQISKNIEFFNTLIENIKNTFKLFKYEERIYKNVKNISFSPEPQRIQNVFIVMDINGEITFSFNVISNKEKYDIIYNATQYSFHTELYLKGINNSNYIEYLPYIVKALEFADYSFVW
jgi:hypothetical protein